MPSVLPGLVFHLTLTANWGQAGSTVNPVLQTDRLRPREVNCPAQDHPAHKLQTRLQMAGSGAVEPGCSGDLGEVTLTGPCLSFPMGKMRVKTASTRWGDGKDEVREHA